MLSLQQVATVVTLRKHTDSTDTNGVTRIPDIYTAKRARRQPVISVEFFPPKTPRGDENLFQRVLPELVEVEPDFCSVTYGAGGSTRDKTLEVTDRIQTEFDLVGMAHLTCLHSGTSALSEYLTEAEARGIENILALRGDPPVDFKDSLDTVKGFNYAYQLVEFIKANSDTSIGCAGFPEGHIACKDTKQVDWKYLQNKISCGAQFVLTQLFFDNSDYFEMTDYLQATLGVTVPITPGVLPILSTEQIKRFTALCGATLPQALVRKLDELGNDDNAVRAFGIDYATRQCEELLAGGAPGLHMYSLNRSRATVSILKNLGLR